MGGKSIGDGKVGEVPHPGLALGLVGRRPVIRKFDHPCAEVKTENIVIPKGQLHHQSPGAASWLEHHRGRHRMVPEEKN